jgi:hypothetical protein
MQSAVSAFRIFVPDFGSIAMEPLTAFFLPRNHVHLPAGSISLPIRVHTVAAYRPLRRFQTEPNNSRLTASAFSASLNGRVAIIVRAEAKFADIVFSVVSMSRST